MNKQSYAVNTELFTLVLRLAIMARPRLKATRQDLCPRCLKPASIIEYQDGEGSIVGYKLMSSSKSAYLAII